MSKADLRLDWCSYEAAKYAVEHWHYSRSLSSARNVYLGVWENRSYVGAVVFGIGSGNATNGERYGLRRAREMAELTRVAIRGGHISPVSRMVAVALRLLHDQSPGIRLVISMADPRQGHHGGIYQACGWIYTGVTKPDVEYLHRGMWTHHRTVTSAGSAKGLPFRRLPGKHRYLMPLDAEMRARILPLAQPYPKRAGSIAANAATDQVAEGGAAPTPALHTLGEP